MTMMNAKIMRLRGRPAFDGRWLEFAEYRECARSDGDAVDRKARRMQMRQSARVKKVDLGPKIPRPSRSYSGYPTTHRVEVANPV